MYQLLSTEAQSSQCNISGGQCTSGTGISPSTSVSPYHLSFCPSVLQAVTAFDMCDRPKKLVFTWYFNSTQHFT